MKFLCFYAIKNIVQGEEVTIDYALTQMTSIEGRVPRLLENLTVRNYLYKFAKYSVKVR